AWREVAVPYAASFGSLTTQAIEPMLDALAVGEDTRLLDLACGPGWLSAAAVRRGAWVLGADLSPTMLAQARATYPHIEFKMVDAQSLPFNPEFDAVAMNFGLLHVGRPEQVIAEAFRVLKAGGRFGFTVWAPPDRAKAFGIVL